MDMIDQLFTLFDRFGDHAYGEDVTQREHALQVAYFAREAGETDALVVAALLHDIGQLLDGAGAAAEQDGRDARHEISGAAFLQGVFPESVLAPIRLHVAAKRYLCAVDASYAGSLSAASVLSLCLQGGPFTDEEASVFAGLPFSADAIRLRRHDDVGKQAGLRLSPLSSYRPLIESLIL